MLDGLNAEQREAVLHGDAPLLIIAGAGSGKTTTLCHRVANQIREGVDPRRILLLTFTRRASAEMLRRVDVLLRGMGKKGAATGTSRKTWGGTFHATASRLLRMYGKAIGLDPGFTIHDRSDSEDLMNVVRTDLGLVKADKRFPKKRTCMAIYSHAVNSQEPLDELLPRAYPWCEDYIEELKHLFRGYVDKKDAGAVLDYDDLLLFWLGLLEDERAGRKVRERFDSVFVDEYQDTNRLQADILRLLTPDGRGLTVVGDDAQSIYSFRAATIRNILDFPKEYEGVRTVTLEQNYRSTEPILEATNRIIAVAKERFTKNLWSARGRGEKPFLVTCTDEDEQAEYIIQRILEHREQGLELRDQAVLFRASHHSIVLEAELGRHNIPFVKYGGLKFLEAAHVKDLMSFMRLAENPRDLVAGSRVLMLLRGIGPVTAQKLMELPTAEGFAGWETAKVPRAAEEQFPSFVQVMKRLLKAENTDVAAQVHLVREFLGPLVEEKYDNPVPRRRDLEQIEQLSSRFNDRQTMLNEMALDPPSSTEDLAGEPHLDEDYLILSTIHSAKGLEWNAVYVLHAADGNIPSDMATGSPEETEEELRLFYVALTRAKDWLYVCFPLRYYKAGRGFTDDHMYAQRSRFLTDHAVECFEQRIADLPRPADEDGGVDWADDPEAARARVRKRVRSMWSS